MNAIAVFGDSITFGRGNNIDRGWVGRLRRYFEVLDPYNAVYNMGIPGETTTGLLGRMDVECKARLTPRLPGDVFTILIAIGTNDACLHPRTDRPETSPLQFEQNLRAILEIARKYTGRIAFVGLTPVDEEFTMPYEDIQYTNRQIMAYDGIIQKICTEEKILVIDLFNPLKRQDLKAMLMDGLHPSSQGYEFMYRIILQELERLA